MFRTLRCLLICLPLAVLALGASGAGVPAQATAPPATAPVAPAATGTAGPAETPAAPGAERDAASYVEFVLEDDGDCILREAKHVSMRNTHPTRTIRVWLDRYTRGVGTGDRSRTDLKPGAEPDPLGCSRVLGDPQEWRVVRAQFLD